MFLSIKINLKNKAVALSRCLLDVEGGLMVLGYFFLQGTCFFQLFAKPEEQQGLVQFGAVKAGSRTA